MTSRTLFQEPVHNQESKFKKEDPSALSEKAITTRMENPTDRNGPYFTTKLPQNGYRMEYEIKQNQ